MTLSKPRIVCAANYWPEQDILITGIRHMCPVMHKQIEMYEKLGITLSHLRKDCIQGFVDQHGKFYTREEAWVIASENNQIFRRCGGDGKRLYSENLY